MVYFWLQAPQCQVQAARHRMGHTPDCAINQAGGFAYHLVHGAVGVRAAAGVGCGERRRELQDIEVHGLHQVGYAQGGVNHQAAVAVQIGPMDVPFFHG